MGMARQQIAQRFDAIVDFAELGHVLDTPVKMYSSGMQLRLGFSIASHLDPDVFVVDEALAVGDAAFQSRCVERMMQLVAEGRTLLFVSHDLSAVESICKRGLFLLDGRIECIGETRDVLRRYLNWVETRQYHRLTRETRSTPGTDLIDIEQVSFVGGDDEERHTFRTGEDIEIRLHVRAEQRLIRPIFSIGISDGRPGSLILCSMLIDGRIPEVLDGDAILSCRIRNIPLLPRLYQTWCGVRNSHGHGDILQWQMVGAFRIVEGPVGATGLAAVTHLSTDAPIYTAYEWRWEPSRPQTDVVSVSTDNGEVKTAW